MIEQTILGHLIQDETYCRAVLPYLKDEYFSFAELTVFKLIRNFVEQFNSLPTKEALAIGLTQLDTLNEQQFKDTAALLDDIEADPETNRSFLIEQTEKFAQEKALINALRKSIAIVDDPKEGSPSAIPSMLQEALAVCFDPSVGHDYFENAGERFLEYHREKKRLRFDLEYWNTITNGGLLDSTMLVLMGSPGGFKSGTMVHFAANHLMQGKNVIYFTMEMSEHQISQRIDHNLLGVPEDELMQMSAETYNRRVAKMREKTKGKLIVKGFPSGSASVAHFRHALNEAKLKKNFVPDVIYVDYLNICSSARVRMGGTINSYVLVGAIAVELRGLAQECKVPLITATQTNREGINSSDVDLTNTSDSVGIPQTADYMVAIINSEELEQLGQIMYKQLKNRYGDTSKYRKFVCGVDRSRMRLFDVENGANEELIQDTPVLDRTDFGKREENRRSRFSHFK